MRLVALTSALLVSSSALGWGYDGHRKLASMMQNPLPAGSCLKAWLQSKQTTALQDSACDPDRWRCTMAGQTGCDADEWPRHFLEVDWVYPPSTYPRDWNTALATLGQFSASRNGRVPWRVEEMYGQLVAAFAAKNEAQILTTVFLFSHYVTDAFSLLHDTKNFDPNGIHQRWESDMLQNTTNLNGVATLAETYYGTLGKADPKNNIFDIVIVGNGLVPTLLAADTSNSTLSAFYTAVKDLTARRWGDALTLLASLIWSAWADAGAPNLTGFSTTCSRATPSGEIVLKGYPVAGGFTHPDAGTSSGGGGGSGAGGGNGGGAPGGSGGASSDAGVGGGSVGSGGGGIDSSQPVGCGCSTGPVTVWLALGSLWLVRRARKPA